MKQRMTQRGMSRGVSRKVAQLQSPSLALSSSQRPVLELELLLDMMVYNIGPENIDKSSY